MSEDGDDHLDRTLKSIRPFVLDPSHPDKFEHGAAILLKVDGSQLTMVCREGSTRFFCRDIEKDENDRVFGPVIRHLRTHVVPKLPRGYAFHMEMINACRQSMITYPYAFLHGVVLFGVQRLTDGRWATISCLLDMGRRCNLEVVKILMDQRNPCTAECIRDTAKMLKHTQYYGAESEGMVIYGYTEPPVGDWVKTARRKVVLGEFQEYKVKGMRRFGSMHANILDFASLLAQGFTHAWVHHLESHLAQRGEPSTPEALVEEANRDIDDFVPQMFPQILLYARTLWTAQFRSKVVAHLVDPTQFPQTPFICSAIFEVVPEKRPPKKDRRFMQDASIRTATFKTKEEQQKFKGTVREVAVDFAVCFNVQIPLLPGHGLVGAKRTDAAQKFAETLADQAFTLDRAKEAWQVLRPYVLKAALKHIGLEKDGADPAEEAVAEE